MESARHILNPVIWIFTLLICSPAHIIAQEKGQEEIQYLEGEMYQRARQFAVQQYYRAAELGSSAERIRSPSQRIPYYEDMLRSLNDARRLFDVMRNKPAEYDYVPSLITKHWANEHNAGVKILMDEQVYESMDNPLKTVKEHLENAIFIQPDSAISYVVLGSLLYDMEDTIGAISMYEKGIERMKKPEIDDFDFLINLYFSRNRLQDVRRTALEAREIYPEEVIFVQYLTDYYLETGRYDNAIELIHELIENDPDKPQYYYVLGVIYQNQAADLFERRDNTNDLYRAMEFDENARLTLTKAMENYEKAAERDPGNPNYWKELYSVYSTLGMTQKADLAFEKAGF